MHDRCSNVFICKDFAYAWILVVWSYPSNSTLLGLNIKIMKMMMPMSCCVWFVKMKINNLMNHLGAILWLLRATYLAINLGHVWWLSPKSTQLRTAHLAINLGLVWWLSPENILYWSYLGTERGHVAWKESHHHFRIIKTWIVTT
jgi:hypothetical protein